MSRCYGAKPVIADPRFAPRRGDLPWLRRRRLPRSAAPAAGAPAAPAGSPPAAAPAAPPAAPSRKVGASAVGEFLTGHSTGHHDHPHRASTTTDLHLDATPSPSAPSPSRPTASSSLDLDATPSPSAPSLPTPSTPAASGSLDLDAPAPSGPSLSTSGSLDLDDAPLARATGPIDQSRRRRLDQRVRTGQRLLLTPGEPTVTLTRLQSGIGTLWVEAAASDEVGDLRLGAAYELGDGLQTTVQMSQGERFAPPHSKRPVLVAGRERFEEIGVDLRQVRRLRRMVVYAFSERRQPLRWGGTLVLTTHGGARVELPLDSLQGGDCAALLSVYQVRGELVLRAEMQALYGDVREVCRTYGYERITWLDDRTPVA